MSVGNLKDQGNKGNNFPYQRSVLELLGSISSKTDSAAVEALLAEIRDYDKSISVNVTSKINRIKGTDDYSRVFTYYGSTVNVHTVVHTGTTSFGTEIVTETFTYVDQTIDGSNITSIIYS